MSKRGRPYPDDVITPLEEEIYDRTCDECGRDMGYAPPSHICGPCEYLAKRPRCVTCKKRPQMGKSTNLCFPCFRGVPVAD